MNKVIIMGRLTADPDYRQTPQGTPTCRFTVAVNRNFVSKNSGQRETDFISVQAWRNTADFVSRYFSKGKPIIIEGSLRNNNYTDKNGIQHYEMYVLADNVSFTINDNSMNNGGNYGANNYQQGGYGSNGGYQGNYGNGGYNNNGGYGQNNYNSQPNMNNGYYQAQPPQQQPAPPVYQQLVNNSPAPASVQNSNDVDSSASSSNDNLDIGNLDDFEEILSDGEIPF